MQLLYDPIRNMNTSLNISLSERPETQKAKHCALYVSICVNIQSKQIHRDRWDILLVSRG